MILRVLESRRSDSVWYGDCSLRPRSLRLRFSGVAATRLELGGILLTHAHTGHYTGLLQLGKEAADAKNVPVRRMNHRNVLEKNAAHGCFGAKALCRHAVRGICPWSITRRTHPPTLHVHPKENVAIHSRTRTSCSCQSRCSAPRRWHTS